MPNQPAGAFWAVLNRLFIIGQTVVLIFSEFGFPSAFFTRYFPVLGKNFGLGALGVIQMLYVPLPPFSFTAKQTHIRFFCNIGSELRSSPIAWTRSPSSLPFSSSPLGA